MSFDITTLNAAIATHGAVRRVVIVDVKGSSPREIGASMLLWNGGQSGTIGGGALEYMATTLPAGVSKHPLGPELGQCCGGHVTLVTELFDTPLPGDTAYCRPVANTVAGTGDKPLTIARAERDLRNGNAAPHLVFDAGWLFEPTTRPAQPLWIWGAGHVGRAVVDVMADMPDFAITWVDTSPDRFPAHIAPGVTVVPAAELAVMMGHAPMGANHLIFTYSHQLDLALCHGALGRGFRFCGLIGSPTKWARFRKRLGEMGHTPQDIDKITCPIGNKSLGKHPRIIAVGVAHSLLLRNTATALNLNEAPCMTV